MDANKIHGWLLDSEIKKLRELAKDANSWLEIGAWCGKSTYVVASSLPKNATLTVVEPFKDFIPEYKKLTSSDTWVRDEFQKVLDWINYYRPDLKINLIEKTSQQAVDDIPSDIDVAFIDGDHSYEGVAFDYNLCLQKVRVGGIISGHDYTNWRGCPGVKPAVDFCSKYKASLFNRTSIWWIRKEN